MENKATVDIDKLKEGIKSRLDYFSTLFDENQSADNSDKLSVESEAFEYISGGADFYAGALRQFEDFDAKVEISLSDEEDFLDTASFWKGASEAAQILLGTRETLSTTYEASVEKHMELLDSDLNEDF